MLTTRVAAIAPHPTNAKALLWNPAGASIEDVLAAMGLPHASLGVIGGADVFQFAVWNSAADLSDRDVAYCNATKIH